MKKLDNKMRKEKEAEPQKFDSDLVDSTNPCDCCSELPTLQPVTARMDVEERIFNLLDFCSTSTSVKSISDSSFFLSPYLCAC
jgi:hypothetical protein